ncbi:MAG: chromosomal replication initiator protein DnaA [Acutalibacteraceae bacterium]
METLQDVWQEICAYCKTQVNEVTFNAWFSLLSLERIDGSEAILNVKTEFQKKIILENYKHILDDAFLEVLKFPVNITIKTEADKPISPIKFVDNSSQYEYTFDTFIVGSSNRFAHAASLAVAENRDVIYNPLFIWGNSGLGKTHLLTAISSKIKENFPDKKIVSVTCEAFTNEVIYCIQHGTTHKLREKYRTVDVLLIDDIQFIGGKEATQEEFFNTFNDLYDNHKQIVLTSDRPPKDIATLSDRMLSRFEAGLVADIQPPEYETRVGIIKRKAQLMNFDLDEEIISYVADHVKCNIRQLEGVVKKLQAYSLIYENLTLAVAETAIRDIKKDDLPEPVTIQKVVDEVSKAYSVSIDDIYSKKQDAPIAHARQIAMYIIRKVTDMSYKSIGKEFGGKNHATVLYSCNNVEKLCATDEIEAKKIDNITKNLVNK